MPKNVNRVFLIVAVTINILIFADSIDYYLAQGSVTHALRYFTSATGYTFRVVPIIMLATILKRDEKIKYPLLFLPSIVNGILAYTSIFTKWMFYFDENNQFHRGPIGSLPFIVSGIYLIFLLFWSVKKYRIGYKLESAIMFFIIFMSALSSAMETVFHFKFIINGIGGIATVFYYLFLHTQTYKRDALTQALNRHSFYMDCDKYMKIPTIIISIDINDLKKINDTEGHAQGDLAITTVANILQNEFAAMGSLYRMGGDEFVLLCPRISENVASSAITKAEKKINETPYRIAWGLVQYKPPMNFEKALSESDAYMYKDKEMKKRGKA